VDPTVVYLQQSISLAKNVLEHPRVGVWLNALSRILGTNMTTKVMHEIVKRLLNTSGEAFLSEKEQKTTYIYSELD
jgi:hypothetical protein